MAEVPIEVVFDIWYEAEGKVWIAESRTSGFGICTDADSRETLARKLEIMVADLAAELRHHNQQRVAIIMKWTASLACAA